MNTKNANVIGKLDPATLARRLAQTKAEKARRFQLAEERKARGAYRAFAGPSPLAIAAQELSRKLTQEREEAERIAATGRENGKFVGKPAREQAADRSAALTELGF